MSHFNKKTKTGIKPPSNLIKKSFMGMAFFLLAFFIVNQFLFFKKGPLEKISTNISYPFIWATSKITMFIQTTLEKKESYEQLQTELKLLKQKYDQLYEEHIKICTTHKFDHDTKELREFKERYNLNNTLLAKILVKNLKKDEHFFLINRGSINGVRKNMVGIYKLQLLGKITEVYDFYSKLTLITDESCKVAALTNLTNANGIVIGKNQLNHCKMDYVSHLLNVIDNDLIFSSGQGLIFPEGFCLGKIIKHNHSHNKLYHEIELETLTDFKEIKYCLLTDQTKINQAFKFQNI